MQKSLKFAKQKLEVDFSKNKNYKILGISRGQCKAPSPDLFRSKKESKDRQPVLAVWTSLLTKTLSNGGGFFPSNKLNKIHSIKCNAQQ